MSYFFNPLLSFKQEESTISKGLNPALLADVNIILSHLCDKRCGAG